MTRAIRIEGDIAYVPLTKGYEAVIDAADVPLVDGQRWSALVKRNGIYAVRTVISGQDSTALYMHRLLAGDPSGLQVDHADGNSLNNRRSNLRPATVSQNAQNRGTSARNTSGYKGVHRSRGKWRARIVIDGASRCLGRHDTPEAAHAAYCKASAELHGEFGRTA